MKRIVLYFALAITSFSVNAQRRNVIPEVEEEVKNAIALYDFEGAQQLLETRIAALERRRRDTSAEEEQIEALARLQTKLEATEKIIFIDSVIVDKAAFLKDYRISSECGKIRTCNEFFKNGDTNGCTVFCNQLGSKAIFGQADGNGSIRLYMSHQIGGEWSEAEPLNGLSDNDIQQNYPYMLSDGATLYFAAINEEEGLGGFDIYMTRYDADDKTFLTPENIGMPFNSPANDYMYVIDEFNNLGWFATDRNQEEGKVCIYTFIPNTTRRIYNLEEVDQEELARLARLTCIRDTWFNNQDVNNALQRKRELNFATASFQKRHDFDFILNDDITYTTLSDFTTEQGRLNAKWWMENSKDLTKMKSDLESFRNKYATSTDETKEQLSSQILTLEQKVEQLYLSIREQEKAMREAELQAQ